MGCLLTCIWNWSEPEETQLLDRRLLIRYDGFPAPKDTRQV